MNLKVGDRVRHINHGLGTITGDGDTPSGAIVRFDKGVYMGRELEVSTACLTKIEMIEPPYEVTHWASHDHIHISKDEHIIMRLVADCGNQPEAEETANFIVKACNNHYQLVSALNEIANRELDVGSSRSATVNSICILREIAEKALGTLGKFEELKTKENTDNGEKEKNT